MRIVSTDVTFTDKSDNQSVFLLLAMFQRWIFVQDRKSFFKYTHTHTHTHNRYYDRRSVWNKLSIRVNTIRADAKRFIRLLYKRGQNANINICLVSVCISQCGRRGYKQTSRCNGTASHKIWEEPRDAGEKVQGEWPVCAESIERNLLYDVIRHASLR